MATGSALSDPLRDTTLIDIPSYERLRRIGLRPAILQGLASLIPNPNEEDPAPALMRVTELQRETLQLHDGEALHGARVLPALRRALAGHDADGPGADALAVGDWVLARRDAQGGWWVHARLPPLTQLARRLHDGRDRLQRVVIVANCDTALLVMGLDADCSLRRLERFVALATMAGVEPVVVLTKADLAPDAERRIAALRAGLPAGLPLLAVDARSGDAAQALAPWLLPGHTLVLLGSSGAGKSTLTNTLCGVDQVTQATRTRDGRGQHTTTARSLHLAPGGACVIDTPGLRTLRLDGDAERLDAAFGDVAALAARCRFRDCRHDGEPGCAVQGQVDAARLHNWHKLQREAARDTMSVLERQRLVAQWKVRGRAGKRRALAKRRGDEG